jgi:prepilin-type N-terminal cleavage/methylation domain-containing protein
VRRAAAGFTLVESLVALVLAAFLLTSGMALFAIESGARRRLAAAIEADRGLESAYERLRGGLLPLDPGTLPAGFAAEAARIDLAVEEAEPEGLYRIRLTATYRATGAEFHRTLEALLWRP